MNQEIKYFLNDLLAIRNLSNKTLEAYGNDLNKFYEYLTSINKDFNSAINEDIYNYLNKNNFKNKSYNRKMTALKEFYNYEIANKKSINVDVNRLEHIKNEKVYPRIIKLEDIKKMIAIQDNNILGERNKVIIMMLYITGLRVSELVNLTYSDINFTDGYIRVIGKGNKEKVIVVGELLKIALDNYTNNVRNEILFGLESKYVFVNENGKPLSRQMIYNIISESAKKADIKLKVTPHTLRHCFATHMLENGADIRSVQELLGHKDISTTQIYLNISKNKIKDDYFKKFQDPLNLRKEDDK